MLCCSALPQEAPFCLCRGHESAYGQPIHVLPFFFSLYIYLLANNSSLAITIIAITVAAFILLLSFHLFQISVMRGELFRRALRLVKNLNIRSYAAALAAFEALWS